MIEFTSFITAKNVVILFSINSAKWRKRRKKKSETDLEKAKYNFVGNPTTCSR
jgi:hypothetical protein